MLLQDLCHMHACPEPLRSDPPEAKAKMAFLHEPTWAHFLVKNATCGTCRWHFDHVVANNSEIRQSERNWRPTIRPASKIKTAC